MKQKSTLNYCESHPTKRHYWQKMGTFALNGIRIYIVYKCSQCNKCKSERVEWVEGGFK